MNDIKRIGIGARMSEAVCYNGIVWLAGQVGKPGGSVAQQTADCLAEVDRILAEATQFDIATGWLAFAVFIPLAATSMDYAVRRLGKWWKPVQRWTYAAAVLTLLHWASLHNWNGWPPAAVHFAPLAVLTVYRLWWTCLRVRPVAAL